MSVLSLFPEEDMALQQERKVIDYFLKNSRRTYFGNLRIGDIFYFYEDPNSFYIAVKMGRSSALSDDGITLSMEDECHVFTKRSKVDIFG